MRPISISDQLNLNITIMKLFYSILFLLVSNVLMAQNLYIPECSIRKDKIDHVVSVFEYKYSKWLDENLDINEFPRSYSQDGLRMVNASDWTSGFFPGTLWYLYEFTGKDNWKAHAENWTAKLEEQKYNFTTHDIGFMMYCSYGNGYRLTGSNEYKQILLTSANTLTLRYNPMCRTIKSWGNGNNKHTVIIDNMMNLELLFWATENGSSKIPYDIAVAHANTTMENHFRDDYSSYHVLSYDPENGNVMSKRTFQGYADNSAWARGQSWAIYGYMLSFRETGDEKYLNQAQKCADYYLSHLPDDYIPYWDFMVKVNEKTSKESSAAAITASALLQLSMLPECTEREKYFQYAEKMLMNLLSEQYCSDDYEKDNLFVIKHSNGNVKQHDDYNAGINYTDYYLLEALLKYCDIMNYSQFMIN